MRFYLSGFKKQTANLWLYAILVLGLGLIPQLGYSQAQEYTVLVYNVENLFDADQQALYDDYLPTNRYGEEQYSLADVRTKIAHITEVFRRVQDGKGPDIAVINELEADLTPTWYTESTGKDASRFLKWYKGITVKEMLTPPVADSIRTLPAEWLLLKSLADAGFDGYHLSVGYNPRDGQGNPENVQKNAVLSRLPINREKTRIHVVHRARPILEVWLEDGDDELVLFANHWKSGASSFKMEQIRIQNAQVLHDRVVEIQANDPTVDFIVAGDLNSSYNQSDVYGMSKTGLNTVLGSTRDRSKVIDNTGKNESLSLYNLWYEVPIEERGSDTYRGEWGTLIHALLGGTMFDDQGFRYKDRSLKRLQIKGFNAYQTSGTPRRWSSFRDGFGYSDHLPLVFTIERGFNEPVQWSTPYPTSEKILMVKCEYPEEFYTLDDVQSVPDIRKMDKFYDQYFYLPITLNDNDQLVVAGKTYKPYSPGFNVEKRLREVESGYFYGRLLNYRGTWEFLIETPDFVLASDSID